MKPHVIHAAKINREMARKWLTGAPIRPVKCKTFGSKRAKKSSNVTQVQRKLKGLGLYRGAIDGSFGPGTRSAIGRFQKACGMPMTLLPDGQTLKRLDASPVRADHQITSANAKKETHQPFNGAGDVRTASNIREAVR